MKLVKRFFRVFFWSVSNLKDVVFGIENAMFAKRGVAFTQLWKRKNAEKPNSVDSGNSANNQLRAYFDANTEGNGIWKFHHYFDVYERHFSKFVGKEVHIVEVGIYSGGSLKMWQSYFGDKCKVYGIDIQDECKSYESDNVKIFIGDQESRDFWRDFKKQVPRVDILIDDGGHLVEQQIATLEEILPHISPGGVYLCEDAVGERNKLTAYFNGIQNELNRLTDASDGVQKSKNTGFQQQVFSVHQYPYVFVIEKHAEPVDELAAPKNGTVWAPFFKAVEK
jgi:hypothetical protein